ncbi:Uncharacterized protein BM_BM460 [Brugia malayi]|uniref:Uncharacterized protein n=1 Tax=Brugia malayi TaxID=6279 RepID=A0A4E9FJZ5_BRUMA|nr:Uncharacterized protein BM_BM9845 [Brugia malayi]XP_042936776.1 Uncharacterized protein BM_BM460 [Brugia malayi]VIO97037.1 Uncharacterized protein BM_BM9845 [Brugia malayi]VIO97044.1 Uncharacterized protein BM_BM460 [Brugia malayi]
MAKLLVYIAFIIYCGGQAGNQAGRQVVAAVEIITDYKIDKLWDDGSLTQTTQVEESMLLNCDRMEDGRVSILEEKPLLFVRNTLNLIK